MYYLRSYPLSLLTAAAICYLSFFTPPQTDMDGIPNIDKIVHICMYGGLSTLLWIEYLFRHPSIRRGRDPFYAADLRDYHADLDSALAELVGGINEFAVSERDSVKRIGKNKYTIAGLASLYKVEDFLDIDFKTDQTSTFGGLITHTLGRFPEVGEQLYFRDQHARVIVDKVDERSVAECTVIIEDNEEQQQ